ncbi:MAG: hypothetical protein ACOC95_09445 [Planctomycetota bacterium]
MSFLKRHGFYIGLVAALIIINGAVFAMMIRPWSKKAAQGLEQKIRRSRDIGNLSRGGKNAEQVEAEKQRVKKIKETFTEMMAVARDANRRWREPLEMTSNATGEPFPVFPVDEERYEDELVQFRFAERYAEAMDDLFASLNATMPPTDPEIESATRMMLTYLQEKVRGESEDAPLMLPAGVEPPSDYTGDQPGTRAYGGGTGRDGTGMYGPGGGGTGMYGPGGGTGMYGPGGGTGTYGPGTGGATPKTGDDATAAVSPAEARDLAIQNLEILRTQKPGTPLYADRYVSFHDYVLPQDVKADPADMWKAMVNYWLHNYVVNTIRKTNGDNATIENAVVKRLVEVTIGEPIPNSPMPGAMNLYEGESAPRAAADAAGGDMYGGDGGTDMYGPGGGTDMYGPGGGTDMYGPGGGGEPAVEQTLTERTCTQQYDVVNFDLTVVVASSQLHTFLKNLVADGFYTIQKIELYETNPIRATNATNRTMGSDARQDFYYGPQPVVTAVIRLETLFFTDWERDLMPVEMLKRLPDEALRPEDQERITATDATTGTGGETYEGDAYGGDMY